MAMKYFIKNRKGQKIAVLVEENPEHKGLVFVMHGLGGFKEQPQMQMFADVFGENGYTTVRFDAAHTIGESEGEYEDATPTNYYENLEDVIEWASSQPWHQEPFCLIGHSLGGLCTALYAENHSEKVKALAPLSVVVSGKLSREAPWHKKIYPDWQRTGWYVRKSKSRPGQELKLKWGFVEDLEQYDLTDRVDQLNMSVFMAVGEVDDVTPISEQQVLFDAIPGRKELHIIKGSGHTFYEQKHFNELKNLLDKWIKSL